MAVVILGVGGTTASPPPRVPYLPPVPSFGGMRLSSNRGVVLLQGLTEALEGWEGLGPAERTPNYSRPLGRDGEIRNPRRPTRRGARTIAGPVHVRGATARERAELMDAVVDVCTTFDGSPLTLTLNRRGEEVSITGDALFSGGAEFMAQAAWDTSAVVQFEMRCPDPMFYAAERTARQSASTGTTFFPIGPVVLADSSTFGETFDLNVGGSRPAWLTAQLTGPMTEVTLTYSDGTAWGLDLTADPLLGAETITVRTDPATGLLGVPRIEGPDGSSYWRYLTPRGFRPLLPRSDSVTIDVVGGGPGSQVLLSWRPAHETVF